MAPEAPGNLVVLDLSYDESSKLLMTVESVEPPQTGIESGWLRVRFDEAPGAGFFPVGGGAAFVRMPKGFEHDPPGGKSKVSDLRETPPKYMYTHVAQGEGLQLILIMPEGYTLSEFAPTPYNAKEFLGRITIYFRPEEKYGETAVVTWRLARFKGDAGSEAQRLRGAIVRAANVSKNLGAFVDREDPEFREAKAVQNLSATAYAGIALVGLLMGVGLLLFYVYQVPKLVESGSQGQVYYLLLIPWALGCAAFLFGAMRSYARFTHKHLGNALELGGPVVLFCLVIFGGFKLVPAAPETFVLTVRPSSADGLTPIINSGTLIFDLGEDRRQATIEPNGEAVFKGIPSKVKEGAIKVIPQVSGYETTMQEVKLTGNTLELHLVRAHPVTLLTGTVEPVPGPGEHLTIMVEGQDAKTSPDEFGGFKLLVNGIPGDPVVLKVVTEDHKSVYHDKQALPGPVTLKLHSPD